MTPATTSRPNFEPQIINNFDIPTAASDVSNHLGRSGPLPNILSLNNFEHIENFEPVNPDYFNLLPHRQDPQPFPNSRRDGESPVWRWCASSRGHELLGLLSNIFDVSITEADLRRTIDKWDTLAYDFQQSVGLGDFRGEPEALSLTDIEAESSKMRDMGFENYLNTTVQARKFRGVDRTKIELRVRDLDPAHAHRVLDLLTHGQRAFMKPIFKSNGGSRRPFKQHKTYKSGKPAIHRAMKKLITKRHAVAVFWSDVPPAVAKMLHNSTHVLATKKGERDGRCCIHMSSTQSPDELSVNAGYDLATSDQFYPPPILPTVATISEMCCQQRDAFPGEPLGAATADVKSAYCQIPLSEEAACLRTSRLEVENKDILLIYLSAIFGDTRAGHVYNVISSAIDKLHNFGHKVPRSKTYVDDGVIVTAARLLGISLNEYLDLIRLFFGEEGIAQDKIVVQVSEQLIAIGWEWDLSPSVWRVRPKPQGLVKLYLSLFYSFPVECTAETDGRKFSCKSITQIAGLLIWYAAVIPSGNAFIYSLYQSLIPGAKGNLAHVKTTLTQQARRDLDFWRALILVGLIHPTHRPISRSIDQIRSGPIISHIVTGDASTGVGGGAWLSSIQAIEVPLQYGWIRWSADDLLCIDNTPGIINLLEYFSIIYFIILWSSSLRGCVVGARCDNSSAVSWLKSNRACSRAPAVHTMLRFASLLLSHYDINIKPSHIAGDKNTFADFLSRDSSFSPLQEPTMHPSRFGLGIESPQIRQAILWRSLLSSLLKQPTATPSLNQLTQALNQP